MWLLATLWLPLALAATSGQVISSLDGAWTLTSDAGHSLTGSVPGDLITDLERGRIVQDPLYELGFLNNNTKAAPPWTAHIWTYSKTFDAPPSSLLVFEGIKMGARIVINGKNATVATNQFVRYTVPVSGSNVNVSVVFDPRIDTGGRYMASSGGWDFVPYTETRERNISDRNFSVPRTFSRGIWRSVFLSTGFTLLDVAPTILYTGPYATTRLAKGAASFQVNTTLHLYAPSATTVNVNVSVAGVSSTLTAPIKAGESSTSLILHAVDPELWWPKDHGPQYQYDLTVSVQPSHGGNPIQTTRKVGFRSVTLATGNDTDPAYVKKAVGEEGSDDFTMLLRVNGEAIYARGANMVPMDEFEGRLTSESYRRLVESAAEANMNMIRIWGGALWMPDEFYSACDEFGILLYHDMMFTIETGQPHLASISSSIETEVRQQIRRLVSHASIAIWDGCNECNAWAVSAAAFQEVYAGFVMGTVVQEDMTRVVWPSSPASGFSKGVHKLTGLPTGGPLVVRSDTKGGGKVEKHGPYRQGTGISSINPGGKYYEFAPPSIKPSTTGTGQSSYFVSEFGSVVMSSFESMSQTLAPEHWSLHGGTADQDKCDGAHTSHCEGDNVMGWRNHMCDNQIVAFFGNRSNLSAVGAAAFQEQLYQCMVSQALDMKREIEEQRSRNSFGMLVWQLGEVWPTGGWGSLEYGPTDRPGQIAGGRWKPLHHLYSQGLMQDVFAACGMDAGKASCYVVNDLATPFQGSVSVKAVDLSTGQSSVLLEKSVSLPAGPGVRTFFAPKTLPDPTAHAVVVSTSAGSEMVASLAPIKSMALKPAKVACTVTDAEGAVANLACTADAIALYVVLTTAAPGRFEPNAFILTGGSRKVKFLSWKNGTVDTALLKASLRVDHAAKSL